MGRRRENQALCKTLVGLNTSPSAEIVCLTGLCAAMALPEPALEPAQVLPPLRRWRQMAFRDMRHGETLDTSKAEANRKLRLRQRHVR
jgi:hypothetical protein